MPTENSINQKKSSNKNKLLSYTSRINDALASIKQVSNNMLDDSEDSKPIDNGPINDALAAIEAIKKQIVELYGVPEKELK
ncbi:MAG: hypothetical protein DRQ89_11695, partial [Epsilonproteobacteria bacterium]